MAASNRDRDQGYEIMPEGAPYEEGFNLKTVWAALFVGFVMLPGAIYLGLVTGGAMTGAAQWVTVIVFLEIAKRSFVQLKTQEIILIYWVAGGLVMMGAKLGTGAVLFGGPFGGKIWDQYLIQSPQADGLAEYIPGWVAPPRGSEALVSRSFFHRAWMIPIVVLMVYMVLLRINELSLGYALFRVASDVERLPFPMAFVYAGGATALAETSGKREGWRWRVFSTGTFIGVIWGLLYVVVPTLSGLLLTNTVQILPIPFVDFTNSIKAVLPTGMLGIGTDLFHVLVGFVLPFWIVTGTFIGSIVVNLLVNPTLYRVGILHTWEPGMTAIPTQISNQLDFWISFSIGMSLVIMLVGFALVARAMWKRKQEAGGRKQGRGSGPLSSAEGRTALPEGRGDLPIWKALLVWAASTVGFVGLVYVLVPGFPWWITMLFGFLYTPLGSYIGARMIGLTGSPYGSSVPYMREGVFYLSGYQGAAVWFSPMPMFDHSWQVNTFKQLELTKTKFGGIVKLTALTLVVMLVCSFLFWSLIWRLGPIPSSVYPYVQKFWPFDATMQTIWIKSTLPGGSRLIADIINWRYIAAGLGIGGVLYGVLGTLGAPTLIFYGLFSGSTQWPHFVVLQFVGAMFGRFYFAKRFGETKWRAYAPILLAGYACGMGLIGMTSVAIALISKAISHVVF